MATTLAYGAATNQGAWQVQEDGFFADPVQGTFAVADGMGGKGKGDLATKKLLREILDLRMSKSEKKIISIEEQQKKVLSWNQSLLHWNQGKKIAERGAVSLIFAECSFSKKNFLITQCGSCAAVLIRQGQLLPALTSQTDLPSGDSLRWLPPMAVLGVTQSLSLQSRNISVERGDVLFLASGGVYWLHGEFLQIANKLLAERSTGMSLADVAARLVNEHKLTGRAPWNRSLVAIEIR